MDYSFFRIEEYEFAEIFHYNSVTIKCLRLCLKLSNLDVDKFSTV